MTPQVLPCRRAGEGKPVVLVHGYLGGATQWSAEISCLGPDFDVIAPSLAGYGDAAHLAAPTEMSDHARNVLATLDELGIEHFHLLGHSMGGMVAQEIVRLAPERVEKLVLYSTGPQGSIPGRFETMARSRERIREDGLEATARRVSATWLLEQQASPAYGLLASIALMASEEAAVAGLSAMEGWDGRDNLSSIASPTLILWGERDRTYKWPQIELLWKTIPGASLAVLPDCAHAVHLERSTLFNAILGEFLRSSPRPSMP